MSNSSLVNVKVPAHSSNYTKGRTAKISEITIHHMAGILTVEQCGKVFQREGRNGSSHYGIGSDGRIGLYVDEENTAWTNSNWNSNCRAVTIETSNCELNGEWKVSDEALNSLIKLIADIAIRNNLGTLVKGKNLTWHRMYSATTCPGDYLLSKMDYIVEEANKIINGQSTAEVQPKPAETIAENSYLVKINTKELNVRAGAGTNFKVNTVVKQNEVYTIVEEKMNGTTKWGRLKSGSGWISLAYTIKINNTIESEYYPIPNYRGTSIVEALKTIGIDSSIENRKKIAVKNGVYNYSGTAVQNNQLLAKLKAGKLKKI